jgi:cell division protein FtsZ
MYEVDEAAKIITESVDPDANIIFWATIKEDYEWELKITVVATGFDETSNKDFIENKTETKKTNPFGKRSVSDSRIIPSSNNRVVDNSEEDLDIPTFLRKKK